MKYFELNYGDLFFSKKLRWPKDGATLELPLSDETDIEEFQYRLSENDKCIDFPNKEEIINLCEQYQASDLCEPEYFLIIKIGTESVSIEIVKKEEEKIIKIIKAFYYTIEGNKLKG